MEQQYNLWDSLAKKSQENLVEYYKFVLLTGVCKQRTPFNLKRHKKLLKWCVKKKLTVYDIPKQIFQNMQILVVGARTETTL